MCLDKIFISQSDRRQLTTPLGLNNYNRVISIVVVLVARISRTKCNTMTKRIFIIIFLIYPNRRLLRNVIIIIIIMIIFFFILAVI